MKYFAFILCTSLPSAAAFSSSGAVYKYHNSPHASQRLDHTRLDFGIIEPPSDDSDCEESFFDRKKREKKEDDAKFDEQYAERHGLELSEVDRMDSIDQYQNVAGGGIIPGVQLSALMGDD